jgi:hypothetical protein
MDSRHDRAAIAVGSLSRRERVGVRGYGLSMDPNPLTPTLSPTGVPAVPQSESLLTRKLGVNNGTGSWLKSRRR